MLVVNLALFGPLGATIWAVQMAWIPVTAAGIINGIGHYWGYRNFSCEDASRNIVPWGILIGGEELHNNHHAYGTSAKLSSRWYEFDIGWTYIRALEIVRPRHGAQGRAAAQVRSRQAPCRPRDAAGGHHPPLRRADQLRPSLKQAYAHEVASLRERARRGELTPRQCRACGGCADGSNRTQTRAARNRSRAARDRRSRAARRCRRSTRCGRSWPRCGSVRTIRASNCWRACRTGVIARRRATSSRCRISRDGLRSYA